MSIVATQIWYEGLTQWASIGNDLPAKKDIYLLAQWVNKSGALRTGHVELSVAESNGKTQQIAAYQGQDTSVASGYGAGVGFGPFQVTVGGTTRIKVVLSYGGVLADSKEYAVQVAGTQPTDDNVIEVPPKQALTSPPIGWLVVAAVVGVILIFGEARVVHRARKTGAF